MIEHSLKMRYSTKTIPLIGFVSFLLLLMIFFSNISVKSKGQRRIRKIQLLTDEKNHVYKMKNSNVEENMDEKLCKDCILKKLGKHDIETIETKSFIQKSCETCSRNTCQYKLAGRLYVDTEYLSMEELEKDIQYTNIQKGGWGMPSNCRPVKSVAVIIPFRNRENHLPIFLRHMHPILQRQNLHYRIFVVDQVDKESFNRGKLFNVGFTEARKIFPYDCFVFHDVDLLSEDDRNTYDCSTSPQHMCAFLDKFNYKLLYDELFGGVEMFTKNHFEMINGFSNSFWGWGGEDDDLFNRLEWKNLTLWRTLPEKSRYKMIKHKDTEVDTTVDERRTFRDMAKNHFHTDGLVNLQYDVVEINIKKLYTRIKVNLRKDRDKLFGVKDFPS